MRMKACRSSIAGTRPVGLYANIPVTAESLCGLLFRAITTGLAFSRFARSNARIRFSQSVVQFACNGEPPPSASGRPMQGATASVQRDAGVAFLLV